MPCNTVLKFIHEIVQETISAMELELRILKVEASGTNWKLTTSCTFYLNKSSTITLNEGVYTVISFVQDSYLIVKGINEPSVQIVTLPNPTFLNGKLEATCFELSQKNAITSNPFIWLLEPYERSIPESKDASYQDDGIVRLFFMTERNKNNGNDMITSEDYTQCIKPMGEIVARFIAQLRRNKRVGMLSNMKYINHANFTTRSSGSTNKTENKNVLIRNLSGIELQIDIPIKINYNC